MEGRNIIIKVDEEDVEKEAINCIYDIIGRVSYKKGDKSLITMELKVKLAALWKIPSIEIAHIGKGFYHVLLINADYKSMLMSIGTQISNRDSSECHDGLKISTHTTR